MRKIVRLTESDLVRLVKRIIREDVDNKCGFVKEVSLPYITTVAKSLQGSEKKLFDQQFGNLSNKKRFYEVSRDPHEFRGTLEDQFKSMLTNDSGNESTNCFRTRLPFNERNYQYRVIGDKLYVGVA